MLAYHEMGCVGLQAVLAAGIEVGLVVTHPDDPHEEKWFGSVRAMAEAAGVPVVEVEHADAPELARAIADVRPDLIFSFYFRKMIKAEVLALARYGAYNLHGSLLPRYRGRAPVNWVLVNGEVETGVTLHIMDARPDHGAIVGQRAVPIARTDTALTLYRKLAAEARALLSEALPAIAEEREPRVPQDHAQSSYFGGRKPADGRIDWSWPAERVRNLVRAVTRPWPGAFTAARGRRLKVWSAEVVEAPSGARLTAGQLVEVAGDVAVATGDGVIRPGDVELEGHGDLGWADAVRVLQLKPGDALGEEKA